jgi:hypothetical protein
MLNYSVMCDRIADAYDRARPSECMLGAMWYVNAHNVARNLANEHSLTIEQTASIIAVLSAQRSWDENKRSAHQYLQGERVVLASQMQIAKCDHIRMNASNPIALVSQGFPGYTKTSSFAHNIAYPWSSPYVTVDRHAMRTSTGTYDARWFDRPKIYARIAEAYTDVAMSVGLLPAHLQAILWVAQRGSHL